MRCLRHLQELARVLTRDKRKTEQVILKPARTRKHTGLGQITIGLVHCCTQIMRMSCGLPLFAADRMSLLANVVSEADTNFMGVNAADNRIAIIDG